jgi:hypothetical protein
MFCNSLWNQVVWRHGVAEKHCINIKTTETGYFGNTFLKSIQMVVGIEIFVQPKCVRNPKSAINVKLSNSAPLLSVSM